MTKLSPSLHEALVEMASIKTNDAYLITYSDVKELVNTNFVTIKFAGGWILTSKAMKYLEEYH